MLFINNIYLTCATLHLYNLKSVLTKLFNAHSVWFFLCSQKMVSEVYTCRTWNICEDIIVHYTRKTWLSRHLYNLISGFYTCTTWNLYLYGKVTYFTLHSHTLIFITFAKHDFRGFVILVVCYVYLHIHILYLYLCLK